MPITQAQATAAEQAQRLAAIEPANQVRLVAGPGTGKSATIERRVAHLLNNGANPQRSFVISFTRAACNELQDRIVRHCANQPCAAASAQVRVSTMHSLALRILRSAAVLATLYPDDPVVLDDWEQENLYDIELSSSIGCTPSRAAEIRYAHDAQWQTLNPQSIAQAAITNAERQGFDTFHAARRNLYSCVLPGEMVYECVSRLQLGAIQIGQLSPIDHLIVDEFQDLNACDQEFVRRLVSGGANLFVAGDDDQSIYSFRHANPDGIINFAATYQNAVTHSLTACFRCTPAVLQPALSLIAYNPGRLPKQLVSLYSMSNPPVQGTTQVWSFQNSQIEARAIAESCQRLIQNGMAGQEDQIIILIFSRRLQLANITRELGNLGLPYDPQNYRSLFRLAPLPHWLSGRTAAAVTRVQGILQQISSWRLQDTLGARVNDIAMILADLVFTGSAQIAGYLNEWNTFSASLPQDMTLDELLAFFGTDEIGQRHILDDVIKRLQQHEADEGGEQQKRIRILTMHGAKGLSGKVVFIPCTEQGLMPSFRAIQAAGLLIEQRRLFYVSLTRAKACCIVSHSSLHTGAEAYAIRQQPQVRLPRSQFLNEMGVPSTNRNGGLTAPEATAVIAHINGL